MKRYHFNIAGQEGKLGLAGAVFANEYDEALLTLQETLDDLEGRGIIDNYGGSEPQNVELGLSYVCLCTNGMKATLDMFDEIEDP